tara:strand:+ start:221 stop:943 length:723 start_codon:yes stop_codon:yes gene_type:complete
MTLKIAINYSPNFSIKSRNRKNIKFLLIHYTGMRNEKKAIDKLTSIRSKVSCHYFIKKNGQIILMVPDLYIAWHAGISNWKNLKSLNKQSIGIEIQNRGHAYGYHKFSKAQINSTISLCSKLLKKYKIQNRNILAHSDVSYNRKIDPGEKFPWKILAKKKIGNWHNFNQKLLKKLRKVKTSSIEKKEMIKSLKKIGYFIKQKSSQVTKLIQNFQRRYRPELIDGKIDKECLVIAKKISQL